MMIGLPKTTEYNKKIPKQKFYAHLSVNTALKRVFVEQIAEVIWRHKIAPTTMNLAAGEIVTEIEIFEIKLKTPDLDVSVLRQIDKEIPYHIVFLLEYDGKYQAWTAYKEAAAAGDNAFKVGVYYHTDWLAEAALPLKVEGLTVDKVYEHLVRQIAGEALGTDDGESLKASVERDKKRKKLEKKIAALEKKVRKEKQFNKQVAMNGELKKLKKELEGLKHG